MTPAVKMDDKFAIATSTVRQMGAYYSRLLKSEGLVLELLFGKEAKSFPPNKIWVPDIPDDAPLELREMVLWIMYHEMSHLWNTDFRSGGKIATAAFPGDEERASRWLMLAASVHNIVEDPRIELIWNQRFEGTWALAHRATATSLKKAKAGLADEAGDYLFQMGALFINELRNHQFAAQGFAPLKIKCGNPLVAKIYPSVFGVEVDVLKDNTDNDVAMAAAQRIFGRLVTLMGEPPKTPPPPPPPPPKPPKAPIKVGGVVKDKASREYEVVKSINPDGSFEVEVIDKKTAKEIAKRLYEEESSGRKV
jgi:hypothetical protein